MSKLTEIEKLKYWLDVEITYLHIMFAIVLGVIIGGVIWWFIALYIISCTLYIIRRAMILPKDYLKVKKDSK